MIIIFSFLMNANAASIPIPCGHTAYSWLGNVAQAELEASRAEKAFLCDLNERREVAQARCRAAAECASKEARRVVEGGIDVTMIVTTSATPSNPSLDMISYVMRSLCGDENCPELSSIEKIIVADAPNVMDKDPSRECEYKRNRLTTKQAVDAYDKYKANLSAAIAKHKDDPESPFYRTSFLQLPRRHGFALAVREALKQVRTKYVMVVQHDRDAGRPFRVTPILEAMERDESVNYVMLRTKSVENYVERTRSRYHVNVEPWIKSFSDLNFHLMPLIFFYDSTHIARCDYYRRVVFGKITTPRGSFKLRTGDFIEDTFGQVLRNTIKAQGMDAHGHYGTYIYMDDHPDPIVHHVHGRRADTRMKKILNKK